MKQLLPFILLVFSSAFATAQIDIQCDGRDKHSIYLVSTAAAGFYRIDNVDTNPTDTIYVAVAPTGYNGISINKDLNGGSGKNILYAASGFDDVYYYHNGTQWVSTGHDPGTVNPGGTNKYIFSLSAATGTLYRYDGTADATALISGLPTTVSAVYDVATDKAGNFYIFTNERNQIWCFSENGTPIDTFTVSGVLDNGISAGFAILGDRMYWVDKDQNLLEGVVSGKNVAFSLISIISIPVNDLAACPDAAEVLAVPAQPDMPRFAVYPNPTNSNTRIAMANAETVAIYDCTGRQKLFANTGFATDYNFSVQDWTSGLYLVIVTSANGQKAHRTFVVR